MQVPLKNPKLWLTSFWNLYLLILLSSWLTTCSYTVQITDWPWKSYHKVVVLILFRIISAFPWQGNVSFLLHKIVIVFFFAKSCCKQFTLWLKVVNQGILMWKTLGYLLHKNNPNRFFVNQEIKTNGRKNGIWSFPSCILKVSEISEPYN